MSYKDPVKRKAYHKEWRAKNPDRIRAYARADRAKHPNRKRAKRDPLKMRAYKAKYLAKLPKERLAAIVKKHNKKAYLRSRMHRFGLTPNDFFRMLDRQGMKCAICPERLVISRSPRSGRRATAHVDHDHDTGRVRGILCGECNRGLGQFHDKPSNLRAAAAYVEASCAS